jgi:hypothetical protein
VQLNLYRLLEQPARFRPQKDRQRIVNLVRLPKADKAAILTHGASTLWRFGQVSAILDGK